jgi:hypothetical protein
MHLLNTAVRYVAAKISRAVDLYQSNLIVVCVA